MGFPLDEEMLQLVKELLLKLTGFKEDSEIFQYTFKHTVAELQNADSLAFVTQNEIEGKVIGLSDKFIIHGFVKPAQDFLVLCEKFIGKDTPKDEKRNRLLVYISINALSDENRTFAICNKYCEERLNVMKLLFCLSENPTSYLASLPEHLQSVTIKQDEEIDWNSYLWEGVERWSPPPDTDSDQWTDDDDDDNEQMTNLNLESLNTTIIPESQSLIEPQELKFNYVESLLKVKTSVQSGWFNTDKVRMLPSSSHPEANAAISWEKHLEALSYGMINIENPNIISEYKVVREVIQQFWNCHNSVCFKFSGDKLVLRTDVTISSCMPKVFERFLYEFVPYIEMLQEFRSFESYVLNLNPADTSNHAPKTYKSYISSVRNILQPTIENLVALEKDVLKQEEIMTLIKLASICKELFQPVKLLKEIHNNVIIDYNLNSPLKCAMNLLVKLHHGLQHAHTKIRKDIYLCLYLESLYTYMDIIDNWLTKGDFNDTCEEFLIMDSCISLSMRDDGSSFSIQSDSVSETNDDSDGWHLKYSLNNTVDTTGDPLKLISIEVLQIGKNIHLLSMLGKLHLINDFDSQPESLYDEFVREVLSVVTKQFGDSTPEDNESVTHEPTEVQPYKFPAICNDFCKFRTEMDKLDNLVDTDDPFLMNAFESFLMDDSEDEGINQKKEELLYTRISKITSCIFPSFDLIESVFLRILRKRYGGCGRTVMNLLKYDYQLDDHLEILRHVFLFKDGVISEFLKTLFMKIETEQKWGNAMSLNSHLQDIMIDIHPELYDKLTIIIDDSWSQSIEDPLMSTTSFKINFKVKSPINIIIQPSHIRLYNDLFFFIFRIKWGLYMLSRLHFKDIEAKNKNRSANIMNMRLKILRFGLVNIFTLMQHYIMDYIYGKCLMEMEESYNNAHDLDTLVNLHDKFIHEIYRHAINLCNISDSYGFYMLLYLVKKLYSIWKNMKAFDIKKLENYEKNYQECYKHLLPLLCPSTR